MECPFCKVSDNNVIDSRLNRDGISIRRRRECLACSKRFTTYEATEAQLLQILMRKRSHRNVTKAGLKNLLSAVSRTVQELSHEVDTVADQVGRLERPDPIKPSRPRRKPPASKTAPPTAMDTLLKVMRRYRKGVGVSTLKARTGFDDKKIRNIVHRALKQGLIRRAARGVYVVERKQN